MTTSKYGEDLKESLFKPRLPEDDVDLPGIGTIRVRGLSRAEVMVMRKATDTADNLDGPRVLVLERKMIAAAMVDPELTEAEVGQWQTAATAGELEPVTDRIQELSGMVEGAGKSGVPGDAGGPDVGVRPLPSTEAGDAGGGPPGADER
jgi:hypothetical protein